MKDKQIDLHRVITVIISIVWMAFQTYIILGKPMNPMLQVPVHLVFALAIIYLYNPIDKKNEKCYTYSKDGKVTDPAYMPGFCSLHTITFAKPFVCNRVCRTFPRWRRLT